MAKFKNIVKSVICLLLLSHALLGEKDIKKSPHETRRGFYYIQEREKIDLQREHYKVSIWGEVKNPGVYIVPKSATLLDIISITGGPNSSADLSKIRIFNRAETNSGTMTESKNIINLEYFLQKGKFQVVPKIGNETIIIVPKNRKSKFFDSLPKIVNILNIFSLVVILAKWMN